MTATTTGPAGGLRIAVADDDRDTRDFLERALPLLGHTVSSVAANGRELVEHCRSAPPDLILADFKMPGMTGLEAVEAVNRVAAVPAVLLTGHSSPEVLERAKQAGVVGYLVKPVTEHALAPAIALARRHFDQVVALRKEGDDLRKALEERKAIERAKGVVTVRSGVPEPEAYRRMRRLASNTNRKLVEVAEEILAAEDIFRAVDQAGGE